jgi:hypothetical protein
VVEAAAARAAVVAAREVVAADGARAKAVERARVAADFQAVPRRGISTPTPRPAARVAAVAKRAGAMAAAEVGWALG